MRQPTPKQAQSILATALTALAGYVDAIGFVQLGGTFVSFMSGNTTRLGTALGSAHSGKAVTVAGVIGLFVSGVIAGHLLRRAAKGFEHTAVLAFVTALLVLAGVLFDAGFAIGVAIASTFAMGAQNATFERNGEMAVGLTFISSTLVKLGDHVATALTGGPTFGWVPPLLRWCGFAGGAVLGSLALRGLGLDAIWLAAAASGCFAGAAYHWRVRD